MGTAYIATNQPDIESYDTVTFAPVTAVGVSDAVSSLALSPDLLTLYSVSGNLGIVQSYVASTLTVIHSVTLTGSVFENIITSADGTRLYVSSRATNTVFVLDASTLATITTITALVPYGLAVTPTDSFLYVTQETAGTIAVFSIPAYTPVTTITVGPNTTNIVMSIDGLTAYCTNFTGPSVSVIDTGTNTVTTTITLAGASLALDLRITPNDTYVYVVSGFSPTVWQITTASNTVTDTVTTGSTSQHLAITTDSSAAWTTENPPTANQTEVYAIPVDTLSHTISFTNSPGAIVITPTSGFHPTPPVTLTIPNLFIPRKGFSSYDESDYMIDWLAIERWANSWAPTLFIPHKPQLRTPTEDELTANWVQIEIWADSTAKEAMTAGGSTKWTPLFIPRKNSDKAEDVTVDFLGIQNWGNNLR